MDLFKQYKDDFILLLETGFIAIGQQDENSAVKLLTAAELLMPKNALSKIGMGYLHFHKLELSEATKCFENALKLEPKNDVAKAMLGVVMSMSLTEGAKGEKLLTETIKSDDPTVKQVCNTALDFVDTFIKKEPSPLEVKKSKKHKK